MPSTGIKEKSKEALEPIYPYGLVVNRIGPEDGVKLATPEKTRERLAEVNGPFIPLNVTVLYAPGPSKRALVVTVES
jgi:hypothetical protein